MTRCNPCCRPFYPMLKDNYALTFGQIGLLTFKPSPQFTASLLQPLIGALHRQAADRLCAAGRHGVFHARP